MKYFLRSARRLFDRSRPVKRDARESHAEEDRDQNPRRATMDHDDELIQTSLVFN